MSRLKELIARYCPDGVEYKALGEIGAFYGGLTGKSKNDFGSGAKFVTYNNVYGNPAIDLEEYGLVNVGPDERQNTVELGDVLFTISSENREEAGLTSVMTVDPGEAWYLNSFCTGWRLYDKSILLPDFLKHVLRGPEVREAISRTANGVTRFNISKPRLAKVRIPVPPIEVQREVARILDEYTAAHDELVRQLEEEMRLRRQQLAAARNELITANRHPGYKLKTLNEIGSIHRGKRFTFADMHEEGDIPCIHYGEIYTKYDSWTYSTVSFLYSSSGLRLAYASPGDVIMAAASEVSATVGKPLAWLGDVPAAIHDDSFVVHAHGMNPKYLSYALQTDDVFVQKQKYISKAKIARLSSKGISSIRIPVPSLAEQEVVVGYLDELVNACNALNAEAKREIASHVQQLELIRNQLLSFPVKVA